MAPIVARPEPPERLKAAEAAIWRRIVECESPGFIKASQFGMLGAYCVLEAKLELPVETAEFIKISHEMSSLARALRLTNQSRYTPATAARKEGAPRPWAFHKA